MIISVGVTLALALLAMLPGWLLARDREARPGFHAAAAAASLTVVMLATALMGIVWHALTGHSVPAAAMGTVAAVASAATYLATRAAPFHRPSVEWQGLALAAAFIAFGLFSQALAVEEIGDGGLLVHSWYNADWFKHLGHVHALANFGIPARDIFGGGEPLHYYWLSYILPGGGAALGGDAWAALATANAIITALFCFTFYGLMRLVARPPLALLAAFLGLFITAPAGFFASTVFGEGLQALMDMSEAPKGPALLAVAQFIPQHTLAATLLMGWALIAFERSGHRLATTHALALASLASVLTVSTLLGATLLIAYGLIELARRRWAALPELTGMALASAALVLLLSVLQLGNPDSALESPLLTNPAEARAWYGEAAVGMVKLFGFCGLPLPIALFLLLRWKPEAPLERYAKLVAGTFILAAFAAVAVAYILAPARIGVETLIRAVIPAAIGTTLVGAWAVAAAWQAGGRRRWLASAIVAALTIVALPCVYVRTAWMADFSDDYTTLIPHDDRLVLAELGRASDPHDQVWQYPEPPVLARDRGDDNWSAVIAGRAVPNSERATDFALTAPQIALSRKFFEGQMVPIPAEIDWIYASRILGPGGYEAVVKQMRAAPAWRERACYADACLFGRRGSANE